MDKVFPALRSPQRRRILRLLAESDLSLSDVAEMCNITKAGASINLSQLREAQLVTRETSGTRILFRIQVDHLEKVMDDLLITYSALIGPTTHSEAESKLSESIVQKVFGALASTRRRTILQLVAKQKLCPTEVALKIGLTRESASNDLSILRRAGLVEAEFDIPFMNYRPVPELLQRTVSELLAQVKAGSWRVN